MDTFFFLSTLELTVLICLVFSPEQRYLFNSICKRYFLANCCSAGKKTCSKWVHQEAESKAQRNFKSSAWSIHRRVLFKKKYHKELMIQSSNCSFRTNCIFPFAFSLLWKNQTESSACQKMANISVQSIYAHQGGDFTQALLLFQLHFIYQNRFFLCRGECQEFNSSISVTVHLPHYLYTHEVIGCS